MTSNIVERSTPGLCRIDEPATLTQPLVQPAVVGEFGNYGRADYAPFNELFRALHFGIGAAVVGDAEGASRFFRDF